MTEHGLAITSEASDLVDTRRISNSEVSTWLTCQQRYYYEFDLKLAPIHNTEALSRGILGHEVLAKYYIARKAGHSHSDCVEVARTFLGSYMGGGSQFDLAIVLELDKILANYWPIAESLPWEILHVEQQFDVWLTQEFEFSMRLDLLIRDLSDGKIKVVDHKFVYDFWNMDKIRLSGQLPKYIGALRANNIKVDDAILNQIRYRKMKAPTLDQLFQQTPVAPSNARVVNTVRQQIIASQEIMKWKDLPVEMRGKRALRVLNPMVCNGCPVKGLCMEELDGAPIEYLMQSEYKSREYGYNNEPSTAALENLV
jgi:hypothetical protein